MNERPKRVTLHDVAQAAGVSAQTVSRVVNGQPGVSNELRAEIMNIVEQMGYQPNRAAQMLQRQRSYLLEVILVDLNYPGEIGNMLDQVAVTARTHGYGMLFSSVNSTDLEATLKAAVANQVDGFILLAHSLNIADEDMLRLSQGLPFVRMGDQQGMSLPSVSYDFRAGTRMAVEHLIELGHREIAEISGPLNQINARVRHEEWQNVMQEHDLKPGPSVIGDYGMREGYEAARRLIALDEPFTAIFAGNDDQALGILHGLREHGLSVPQDVSIVGFDDAQHAEFLYPPLTTVGLDFRKQGLLTVKYLIDLIEDPANTVTHQRILMPELIIRQSTRWIR